MTMSARSLREFPAARAIAPALALARVAALCLLAAACSAAPTRPSAGPDPANPQAHTPAATYRPVLGGYQSQRPVEPAPWREQNERVAPAPKQ
jgi:hypothetical protein